MCNCVVVQCVYTLSDGFCLAPTQLNQTIITLGILGLAGCEVC